MIRIDTKKTEQIIISNNHATIPCDLIIGHTQRVVQPSERGAFDLFEDAITTLSFSQTVRDVEIELISRKKNTKKLIAARSICLILLIWGFIVFGFGIGVWSTKFSCFEPPGSMFF